MFAWSSNYLKKKVKKKNGNLHTGPIMTTSRHFLSIIYFCSLTSCYGVREMYTYWMTFPIRNLITQIINLKLLLLWTTAWDRKGQGVWVCGWLCRSILKRQTRVKLKPESSWQLSFNYLYWKPSNDINTVLNVCEILNINLQRAQLKQIS